MKEVAEKGCAGSGGSQSILFIVQPPELHQGIVRGRIVGGPPGGLGNPPEPAARKERAGLPGTKVRMRELTTGRQATLKPKSRVVELGSCPDS